MDGTLQWIPLTKEMIEEFRSFVEWILEIDLTPSQEKAIQRILIQEWAENDRETIALVQANLVTFRAIKAGDGALRENWRKRNQPTFVAALDKHVSSELGTSLLEVYRARQPRLQTSNTSGDPTLGQIATGVLGLVGAVVLTSLEMRAAAKKEVDEAVTSGDGKGFAHQLGEIFDARKREVDELSEKDPAAAAMKELENQQMNAELVNSWINTTSNISQTINANMVGDGWRWP